MALILILVCRRMYFLSILIYGRRVGHGVVRRHRKQAKWLLLTRIRQSISMIIHQYLKVLLLTVVRLFLTTTRMFIFKPNILLLCMFLFVCFKRPMDSWHFFSRKWMSINKICQILGLFFFKDAFKVNFCFKFELKSRV